MSERDNSTTAPSPHVMGSETQASINDWITATFGEVGSNISVAARANQEMAELIMKLAIDDNDREAIEEVADVVIVLYRLVHRFDADMAEQINRKMGINRNRTWNVANGHGYHIKSAAITTATEGAAPLSEEDRNYLEEVADGAWGDDPRTRGLARDRLKAAIATEGSGE